MNIQHQDGWVGEKLSLQWSFLAELKSFQSAGQTLVGASVAWTSQTPSGAEFVIGSGGLVSSDDGLAAGIPNDACIGTFELLAAGIVTVYVTVDTLSPVDRYIGIIQFRIEAIPTP